MSATADEYGRVSTVSSYSPTSSRRITTCGKWVLSCNRLISSGRFRTYKQTHNPQGSASNPEPCVTTSCSDGGLALEKKARPGAVPSAMATVCDFEASSER